MRRPRPAFTILELLIVVAIIGLLMAILMPSLGRFREQSRQMACLNNLRQLGVGFMSYVADNDGVFPAPAVGARPDDWFYWHSGRDKNKSRIVPYLNSGNVFDPKNFLCPSDDPAGHVLGYPWSYTVNEKICGWFQPSLKLNQIRKPGQIILVADESSTTADDGCWAPQNYGYGTGGGDTRNLLSNRHVRAADLRNNPDAGQGNVTYADGHAGPIDRTASFNPAYYDPKLP